jgi:hypothetical protein
MNMNDLISGITAALAGDTAIAAWALQEYGKAFSVFENIDLRSLPDEADCPLVIVHPASKAAGLRDRRDHVVAVTAAVFDEEKVIEDSGVIRFAGTRRAETLRQLALSAALGAIPSGCRLEHVAVEYDTVEQFPFCWVAMALTITQENTLGLGRAFYE